jgi:transcriptional regulator with XRE-family HTH domain
MRTAAANGARNIRATWFRRIRIARHLTQAQLAKAVGITANQISRYEHGLDDPSLDILDPLLVTLRCWYPDLLANPDLPDPPERIMRRPTGDVVTGSIEIVIEEFARPNRPPEQYPDKMRCWNCHGRPGECRCYLICKVCGLPFRRSHKCSGVLHRRPVNRAEPPGTVC